MAEYVQREQRIPDQLGSLIAAFCRNVIEADQYGKIAYADFIQRVTSMGNLSWAVEIGILTMDQALILQNNIPIASLVDLSNFGMKYATLDAEFRVSASTEKDTSKSINTKTEAKIKIGGIAAAFGAGGSVKINADTSYKRDERRKSDYSSTISAHIEMERFDPPEGVQMIIDMQNEVVGEGLAINKALITREVDALKAETADKEVPKSVDEVVPQEQETESTE